MEINGEPKPNFSVRKKKRKIFISCEPEGENVESVFLNFIHNYFDHRIVNFRKLVASDLVIENYILNQVLTKIHR